MSRRVIVAAACAALALAACGSSSSDKGSATTAAPAATAAVGASTTVAADEPATTNAPPTPAEVTRGAATIAVKVGTDDFDTTGGKRVVSVPKGTALTITLTAPDAQEYHLHGYDLEQQAAAGETATLELTADQTGQFDLESHTTGKTLLVLVVQ